MNARVVVYNSRSWLSAKMLANLPQIAGVTRPKSKNATSLAVDMTSSRKAEKTSPHQA